MRSSWLEAAQEAGVSDVSQRTAVCGEEIGVEVGIANPLMAELHISRLRASVEASTSSSYQVDPFSRL